MAENELPAVEVRDLVKVYPRPGGGSIRALDGVTFRVEAGEFFGFLGPNGAGKTTALEIIEGIRKPTSGEVRVLGIDPRRELDKVKRLIGVQLQAASYFSLLTIEEILELFGSFYPKRRSSAEVLETVGLSDRRKAYVRHLSGGQQRRFSVAAALVNDPEVVFLDEPTTGLDPQMRHSVWELLRRLNHDEGKTIVLTTPYMVRRGSTVRVRQRACKIPAHGDFPFRTTCSSSHVRWVWSRLWSFRVVKGSDSLSVKTTRLS
jgi:ABC-2 type transport system ATP-binding protein